MNQAARKVRRPAFPHSLEGMGDTPTSDAIARKNAADALQRALDRRDNGGVTGHALSH